MKGVDDVVSSVVKIMRRQRIRHEAVGRAQTKGVGARDVPNHTASVSGSHRVTSGTEARVMAD